MKLHTKGHFFICGTMNYFSIFCVPQLYRFIIGSTQKFPTVVVETYISNSFCVPHVSSQALFICQCVPDFASSVVSCWKNQMAKIWWEFYFLNSFRMTYKCINPLFWYKVFTLLFCIIFDVGRCFQKLLAWPRTVKYRCRFMDSLISGGPGLFLGGILSIFKPVFYHILIFFDGFCLFFSQFCGFLMLKLLHTLIISPWSFILRLPRITTFLPILLPLPLHWLFTFSFFCFFIFPMPNKSILKICFWNMCLFHKTCQMILFRFYLIFIFESWQRGNGFLDLERWNIHIWGRINC